MRKIINPCCKQLLLEILDGIIVEEKKASNDEKKIYKKVRQIMHAEYLRLAERQGNKLTKRIVMRIEAIA